MPFRSLRTFVDALRNAGELHTVDATRQIRGSRSADITDRVVKAGGPALLFTNVEGLEFPGADQSVRHAPPHGHGARRSTISTTPARAYASSRRRAAGGLARRENFRGALQPRAAGQRDSRRSFASGSVHDVVTAQPDLTATSVLTTWPLDAGPFITLPLVITKDPRTRPAQRRHVPHASVRRARDRHALAAAQARPRARRSLGREDSVAVAIGTRPGAHVCGDGAASAAARRVRICRIAARQTGRAGPGEDRRSDGAGRCRVRARRLRG